MAEREWERRYQEARRNGTGMNVLGWLMIGFLAGFGYWWYGVWASIFEPALLSPQWTMTIIIAVVYTIVLPLFWSMIAPNSPAGRLLQKQTWALPGQLVVAVITALLTAVAIYVFTLWLAAQPQIAATSMFYPALLAMITGAIVLPAITWTLTTPEKLIALYRQARIARQLDQQSRLEDLKWKALHARFVMIANSDMKTLTIEKFGQYCEELTTILATTSREEERRLHALESTFAQIHDFELATSDPEERDTALLEQYREVGHLLTNTAANVIRVADYADQVREVNPARRDPIADVKRLYQYGVWGRGDVMAAAAVDQAEAQHLIDTWARDGIARSYGADTWAFVRHDDSRLELSESRAAMSDRGRQRQTVSDPVARRIAAELPAVFTAQNLADLLQQDKRSAQRTIATWLEEGLITQVNLGRYMLTERAGSEAAS